MKRILISLLFAVIAIVTYWVGVYLTGEPLVRGYYITKQYGLFVVLFWFIFFATYSYPAWWEEK